MIQKQSDDPDVAAAASEAYAVIKHVLSDIPKAETFDYGGHNLGLHDYDLCTQCTAPIAEAQQAHDKLMGAAEHTADSTVKEHLELAAELFRLEAEAAKIRAEFHNGQNAEKILNSVLGFLYARGIGDTYEHSHHQGK